MVPHKWYLLSGCQSYRQEQRDVLVEWEVVRFGKPGVVLHSSNALHLEGGGRRIV